MRLLQHGLRKNAVAACRVIYQYVGHGTHQPAVLQDGTSTHALHDAAGLCQKPPVRHMQDHVAVRVGIVYLFNADLVMLGRFSVHCGPDLCIAGHDLLRKSDLCFRAGKYSACPAIDPGLAVDADTAQRVGAQKAALQLTRAAHSAAGTPHDLAGDDLAAAQRNAFAGITVADGMPQTGKHPGIVVHKGHGAYACGGITHPHPGAPLPGGAGSPAGSRCHPPGGVR